MDVKKFRRGGGPVETHQAETRVGELQRQRNELQADLDSLANELAGLSERLNSARIMLGLHRRATDTAALATADSAEIAELRRLIDEASKSRGRLTLQLADLDNELKFAEQALRDERRVAALPEAKRLAAELLAAVEEAARANEKYIEFRRQFPMVTTEWAWPVKALRPEAIADWIRATRTFLKEK